MTFSLCMIVKNEEKHLSRCLDSVKGIFDELVIVDTGSTDETKRVAYAYTDKVYDFAWCDDFSAARNASFSHATGDYVAWLDADDRLDEESRVKWEQLKTTLEPQTDAVMMPYAAAPGFVYYRERLVKRMAHFSWVGFVHEVLPVRGNIVYSDITVHHTPEKARGVSERNLRLYEKKLAAGVRFTARETYYYARELLEHQKNERAATYLKQFLDMPHGWFADKTEACLLLYSLYAETDNDSARQYLTRALGYEQVTPRALCLMGDECLRTNRLQQALFWYRAALECPKEYRKSGFVQTDYEVYYPALSLCVCYDRLGDRKTAAEYNEMAAGVHPTSEAVQYNREYFDMRTKEEEPVQTVEKKASSGEENDK